MMPHSVSPADPPQAANEDIILPDAGADAGETQTTEGTIVGDQVPANGDSQISNVANQDMTMEDAGVEGDDVPQVKAEPISEVKLEDLFADIDSDEEFPSSTGQEVKGEGSPEPQSLPVSVDVEPIASFQILILFSHIGPSSKASDPEVMRSFYQRLFPWRYLFQWLNHSPTPSTDFGHREFAFTLQNDAYLRYQSFPTSDL